MMGYLWKGTWRPAAPYFVNDTIEYGDVGYLCIADHISSHSNEPGVARPTNVWAHVWEKVVELKKHSARKDPFYWKEYQDPQRKGDPKTRYQVLIEEGKDLHQIVYYDIHEQDTAMKLTARLNNAIYRWMVKEGIVS